MFRVPGSSDPPSTPNSRRSLPSNPSTTPAGPPPSFKDPPSFTPLGPPPPSAFGSSQFGTGISKRPLFQSRSLTPKPAFSFSNAAKGKSPRAPFGSSSRFGVPPSSPPQLITISDDEAEEGDGDVMEDVEENGDSVDQDSAGLPFNGDPASRGTKRTRHGKSVVQNTRLSALDTHGTAKGIAAAQEPAMLHEPDAFILETAQILDTLPASGIASADLSALMDDVARRLQEVWTKHGKLRKDEIECDTIGPPEDQLLARANFVYSLLLRLHHPTAMPSTPTMTDSQVGRSMRTLRGALVLNEEQRKAHMPKVLFDWLDQYHRPGGDVIGGVLEHSEGYAAATEFWDAVYSSLFRGRFGLVIDLLSGANFEEFAVMSDGQPCNHQQKSNIEKIINQAVSLLLHCPATKDDDWDIKGPDWSLFRRRVQQAIEDLREFAEGELFGSDEANAFGESTHSSQLGLRTTSRRVEHNVPFDVYEPLSDMYSLLLGNPDDLMKSAFDWVEATIGLTAWWDGEDEQILRGSFATNRRPVMQQTRPVDVTPALAYRQRLAYQFGQVIEDKDLKEDFDPSDAIQIAIASVFRDDLDAVVALVRGWSMTMTSAIVELASAADWFPDSSKPRANNVVRGLDQSDLMVLNYGDDESRGSKKDEILIQYADLLAAKPRLEAPVAGVISEGWQLALTILARLDDIQAVESRVSAILEKIPLNSSDRVDSLLNLCAHLEFIEYGTKIAEKYAERLSESPSHFGEAIYYHARAHRPAKVKEILDVLVSLSLIHSAVYPPASELDDRLNAFLTSPKQSLASLATVDTEASQILSTYLSGYATLRDFYETRDDVQDGQDTESATLHRKRAASPALIAALTSAAESIRGGLFDPSVEPVMQVDGLLVLLGEALPLINQSERILSTDRLVTLLRAAEDLETVNPKIFARCEDVLRAAVGNAHGGDAPSPRALLRKSTSGLTAASSQFSLVEASAMLGSQESKGSGKASEGSGVLVNGDAKRGWDWRQGLSQSAKGGDVVKILRFAVAQEMGRVWAVGDEED